MEKVSLVCAVLALLISIAAILIPYIQQKRISEKTLEAEYYKEIFMEYLLKGIPVNRKKVTYVNEQLCKSYKEFNKMLSELRKSILYFSYRDKKFYNALENVIILLDEKLVQEAGKTNVNFQEQKKFIETFDNLIEKLYKIVFENYFN